MRRGIVNMYSGLLQRGSESWVFFNQNGLKCGIRKRLQDHNNVKNVHVQLKEEMN